MKRSRATPMRCKDLSRILRLIAGPVILISRLLMGSPSCSILAKLCSPELRSRCPTLLADFIFDIAEFRLGYHAFAFNHHNEPPRASMIIVSHESEPKLFFVCNFPMPSLLAFSFSISVHRRLVLWAI
jgi:hypothetical protein